LKLSSEEEGSSSSANGATVRENKSSAQQTGSQYSPSNTSINEAVKDGSVSPEFWDENSRKPFQLEDFQSSGDAQSSSNDHSDSPKEVCSQSETAAAPASDDALNHGDGSPSGASQVIQQSVLAMNEARPSSTNIENPSYRPDAGPITGIEALSGVSLLVGRLIPRLELNRNPSSVHPDPIVEEPKTNIRLLSMRRMTQMLYPNGLRCSRKSWPR
jgi:hypothetical protein